MHAIEERSGVTSAYRAGSVGLEPLVNTFGMELMATGKNPKRLSYFEIAHADDASGLIVLRAVTSVSIRGEHFNVGFSQTFGFDFTQPFSQV